MGGEGVGGRDLAPRGRQGRMHWGGNRDQAPPGQDSECTRGPEQAPPGATNHSDSCGILRIPQDSSSFCRCLQDPSCVLRSPQ
eukprot:7448902-Pyramimonas_sp.AAC.1